MRTSALVLLAVVALAAAAPAAADDDIRVRKACAGGTAEVHPDVDPLR